MSSSFLFRICVGLMGLALFTGCSPRKAPAGAPHAQLGSITSLAAKGCGTEADPGSCPSVALNDGAVVATKVPPSMKAGQSYGVSVTMRNTGTTTWASDQTYRLGS